jgi:hypothetical protein
VTDTASSSPTTPTGTVTFASDLGGGTFSSGGSCTLSPTSTSGQASCSISYTPGQIDSITITGQYGGDSAHASSSGQDNFPVIPRTTSTALTCQQVKPVLDKCTATVTDTSPGTATTPTGTVNFASSGKGVFSATQCTLSGSGTSASCSVYYGTPTGVPMSGQTIVAAYGGDSTHQQSIVSPPTPLT